MMLYLALTFRSPDIIPKFESIVQLIIDLIFSLAWGLESKFNPYCIFLVKPDNWIILDNNENFILELKTS